MAEWEHHKLEAMTPLAIYDEQPDHFVFIYRVEKELLLQQRPFVEAACSSRRRVALIPVTVEHLRACQPALDEAFRRLDGQDRG